MIPSELHKNIAVISISAEGIIYNGIINPDKITSGEMLLNRIDQNNFTIDDILPPLVEEIELFIQQMFKPQSYPIRNHRGETLFSGEGGEGSQVFAYQMYLVRKKPRDIKTYVLLMPNEKMKEQFYQQVIFSNGPSVTDQFPILCESMNESLTN
jgi:D-lactate dehydrogenase